VRRRETAFSHHHAGLGSHVAPPDSLLLSTQSPCLLVHLRVPKFQNKKQALARTKSPTINMMYCPCLISPSSPCPSCASDLTSFRRRIRAALSENPPRARRLLDMCPDILVSNVDIDLFFLGFSRVSSSQRRRFRGLGVGSRVWELPSTRLESVLFFPGTSSRTRRASPSRGPTTGGGGGGHCATARCCSSSWTAFCCSRSSCRVRRRWSWTWAVRGWSLP